MEHPTCEKLPGCLWIFIVPPRADIPSKGYFPNFFPIFLHIDNRSFRGIGLDYSDWQAGYKPVTLACHFPIFLFHRYRIPCWHIVSFCDWSISFSEAIDMDRLQVEPRHLFKEVGRWRTCSYCNPHRNWQPLGFFSVTEQSVHSWCCIEMSDVFFFEQSPDLWVVNLAQT